MATLKHAVNSLLTEHLRYNPLALLDDIIDTVNELVYRAVTAVEEGLLAAPPASLGFGGEAAARAEIEHGVHQLETLLQAAVDKNFDKLEIYVLRNILYIPEDLLPWIRLPHHKDLDFSVLDTPQVTVESLLLLRRKLVETRKLHAALAAEHARNAAMIAELEALTASTQDHKALLSFLAESPTSNGESLDASTRQVTAQLPEVQQILAQLQRKADAGLRAGRKDRIADGRRQHVESQVRAALERDGADLSTGQGLAGPALGSAASADSVKAIEDVARALQDR